MEKLTKGLIIIQKGSLIWETPAVLESLNVGDILYHKQGSYALKIPDSDSECEFLWIALDDQFLREFINHYGTQ